MNCCGVDDAAGQVATMPKGNLYKSKVFVQSLITLTDAIQMTNNTDDTLRTAVSDLGLQFNDIMTKLEKIDQSHRDSVSGVSRPLK